MKIKIKQFEGGKLPEYKRDGDVCMDCYARKQVTVSSYGRRLVPLGFALGLPKGYEAVIRPRSGMTKDGVEVSIGTIDTNYRGELMASVYNTREDEYTIEAEDRICQLAIRKAPKVQWNVVTELSDTVRGANGFGSSGKK